MTVREMLARGWFNDLVQEREPDGSVKITLVRRGDPHVYRLWARDLYRPDEKIIREEVT